MVQRVRVARNDRRRATTTKPRRALPKIPTKTTGAGPDPGTSVVASVAVVAGVAVDLVVAVEVEHVDLVIVSLIKVTSPFRASARPSTVTPLAIVIDVRAMMVPPNVEPDPRVAELVTCQKTLQGWPPLMKRTELDDAVMRSDVAWKIHTEFGSFWPSSYRSGGLPSTSTL